MALLYFPQTCSCFSQISEAELMTILPHLFHQLIKMQISYQVKHFWMMGVTQTNSLVREQLNARSASWQHKHETVLLSRTGYFVFESFNLIESSMTSITCSSINVFVTFKTFLQYRLLIQMKKDFKDFRQEPCIE